MTMLSALALPLVLTLLEQHQHVPGMTHPGGSDYAGLEDRELKVYSDEEVRALENGEGMGYALVAELMHYPGPKHALELESELGLQPKQVERLRAIFDAMHAEAVRLGRELLETERSIQNAFASGDVDSARELVQKASGIEGELRWAHLDAHVATRSVLNDAQVARYDELRGY